MGRETTALRRLYLRGELARRAERLKERLSRCDLCPRRCVVDRSRGELGACGVGREALVSSYGPHYGEERPLSGWKGSGTVFFAGCNLACVFCQNWEISQRRDGYPVDDRELARIFLDLQQQGCHNLNLVTPSHVVPQILAALLLAVEAGFELPVVYNCGGYDALETLELLDGVVDIYLPDFKFADSRRAAPYLGVDNYAEIARAALHAMHRQVGDLAVSTAGIARRGLLVRHLVLPGEVAGTSQILEFLARKISPATYLNLMDQYRPCYLAGDFPSLQRRPSRNEMQKARVEARALGLRLD